MLVKMIDELGHPPLHGSRYRNEVEHREVLHHFAQAHAPRVGAYRHAELGGHENHGEILVHPAEPAAVDLAEADGARLQELLE